MAITRRLVDLRFVRSGPTSARATAPKPDEGKKPLVGPANPKPEAGPKAASGEAKPEPKSKAE
jgi:hypothetical protein